MIALLKLEWSKFSKSNIIVLLTFFFLLFFPTSMYFGKKVPKFTAFLPGENEFYNFPTIWEYLGYSGSWMVFFFLGVLVIYTITHEIRFKTMRQTIINGMSRETYFGSKILTVLVLSLFATCYYAVIGMVIGSVTGGGFDLSNLLDNEWAIPRFFLMSLSYLSFALFIAFNIKKSGSAVFLYLTYVLVIEFFLRTLHSKVMDSSLPSWYPLNATEDLMPFPLLKNLGFLKESNMPVSLLSYGEAAIITSVFILLFIGLTFFLFKRRDL